MKDYTKETGEEIRWRSIVYYDLMKYEKWLKEKQTKDEI